MLILSINLRKGCNLRWVDALMIFQPQGLKMMAMPERIMMLSHPQASLTVGYRYRTQSFDREDEAAVSNSVPLILNYQWDKVTTQRY